MSGQAVAEVSQVAPAWVQAVGSVAAVIIAGRTVLLSVRSARLTMLNGVAAAFVFTSNTISAARQSFVDRQDAGEEPFDPASFDQCEKLLGQVESKLIELGSEMLPVLTAKAKSNLRTACNNYNAANKYEAGSEKQHQCLTAIDESLKATRALLDEVIPIVKRQRRLVKWWWLPLVRDR